ncbi:MAG: hypothetical protein WCU88_12210 [Elusimicrobiota bacterium]|jgi:hypothetical protein
MSNILRMRLAVALFILCTLGAIAVTRSGAANVATDTYASGYEKGYQEGRKTAEAAYAQQKAAENNDSSSSGCCGGS